jgi:hypothetical protein
VRSSSLWLILLPETEILVTRELCDAPEKTGGLPHNTGLQLIVEAQEAFIARKYRISGSRPHIKHLCSKQELDRQR